MANNVLLQQDNGEWATIQTTEAGGVHTLVLTTDAANSSVVVWMPNGQWVRLATVLAGGVHTLAVSS